MLQAALSARLWGSSSASWRVSMPNAMPLSKQEAYLEMMRASRGRYPPNAACP